MFLHACTHVHKYLEELVILQVRRQAYLSLRKLLMHRLPWVIHILVGKMLFKKIKCLFVCVCALPFSWETILVNSLPLGGMKPKHRNVLWLTENVKGKQKPVTLVVI